MADSFTKVKRSMIMQRVKSNNNQSTELRLIKLFKKYRITGWRRNYKLFGKPDFVFPIYRVALFTDGCFWHGHNCRNTKPESNKAYWENKLERNRKRDKDVTTYLKSNGWSVVRVWECEIKNEIVVSRKIKKLTVSV